MSEPTLVIELRHVFDPAVVSSINEIRSLIVTTNADLIAQMNALNDQLVAAAAQGVKAKNEIVAAVAAQTQKISDLQAALAAAGSEQPAEVISAFEALKTAAERVSGATQALDDLNPDTSA
jgi:hypothetical protein